MNDFSLIELNIKEEKKETAEEAEKRRSKYDYDEEYGSGDPSYDDEYEEPIASKTKENPEPE